MARRDEARTERGRNRHVVFSFSSFSPFRIILLVFIAAVLLNSAGYGRQVSSVSEPAARIAQSVLSQVLIHVYLVCLSGLLILIGILLLRQRGLLRTIRTLQDKSRQREIALTSGEVGIWEVDIPNQKHFIDEKMARLLGYSLEEVKQDLSFWVQSVHPEDYEKVMDEVKLHQEKKTPFYEVEYRIRTKQSQWIWVWAKGKIIQRGPDGSPVRISGTIVDITQYKQIEETLRCYEQMISSTRDLMAYVDRNHIYRAANAAYLSAHNKTWEEVEGHSVEELFGKEVYEQTVKPNQDRCLAGEEVTYETWIRLPGLGNRFMRPTYYPVRNKEGRVEGIVVCVHDLTEIRKALEALTQSEEKYRSLVETSSDWIWETDARGVYTYASPRVKKIIGYEPEEILGKTPFELMPPEEAGRVRELFKDLAAAARPIWRLQNINLHKNGHIVVLETNGIPILDEQGKLLGYRGVDRDITERKQAEQSLKKRTEELERFERMTIGRELKMIELKKELQEAKQSKSRAGGSQNQNSSSAEETKP